MARIGCFLDVENITHGPQLSALVKFHHAAMEQGHSFEFLFKDDIDYVPEFDAIFIRATTDPRNATYAVSRLAELHGLKVIDDSKSIAICCNKVHVYKLMLKHRVQIPETYFLEKEDLGEKRIEKIFDELGRPVVLKAPTTNFSKHVEKAGTTGKFMRVAKRFFRRSDVIVVQKYIPTEFDWRVGILDNRIIFGAKYHMVNNYWKIRKTNGGKVFWGNIECVNAKHIPDNIAKIALEATHCIGNGLYGVDIKAIGNKVYVVEVNDNPSIDAGYEDQTNPELYSKIIKYLVS